ncbi:unnamed protein product, partial [Coregonus sp. 'balchen']
TDFNIEGLSLPRRPHHQWALFHEESPKNNYKLFHESLFNHTVTFSHHSYLPLTSQLRVCDPRDAYVSELMKHIQVDSFGQCLHNKDLPPHLRDLTAMEEQAFYQILAFENAICDDYITEKLWRPLKLRVVPVDYRAPIVAEQQEFVVVLVEPPEKLALYLKRLDEVNGEYASYLER